MKYIATVEDAMNTILRVDTCILRLWWGIVGMQQFCRHKMSNENGFIVHLCNFRTTAIEFSNFTTSDRTQNDIIENTDYCFKSRISYDTIASVGKLIGCGVQPTIMLQSELHFPI